MRGWIFRVPLAMRFPIAAGMFTLFFASPCLLALLLAALSSAWFERVAPLLFIVQIFFTIGALGAAVAALGEARTPDLASDYSPEMRRHVRVVFAGLVLAGLLSIAALVGFAVVIRARHRANPPAYASLPIAAVQGAS